MEARDRDEALRQVLPDFAFDRATAVAEQGWDFWTFSVDGEWICFRHDEAARAIEHEFVVLPLSLPRACPWRFLATTGKEPGRASPSAAIDLSGANRMSPVPLPFPRLPPPLAKYSTLLHGIPVELAAAKLEEDSLRCWLDRFPAGSL
ncbi:MAG: hypothetical protein R3C29_00670 [Dehalococcoidia bacterium]